MYYWFGTKKNTLLLNGELSPWDHWIAASVFRFIVDQVVSP